MIRGFVFFVLAAYLLVAFAFMGHYLWEQWDNRDLQFLVPVAVERGLVWPAEALRDWL